MPTSNSICRAVVATATRFNALSALVLNDVINGYVSLEAAEREYGVVIRYMGRQDQLVRPPELYQLDEAPQHLYAGQCNPSRNRALKSRL